MRSYFFHYIDLTSGGDNIVQQFVRLSVINIERIEEVSNLNFTVSQIQTNIELFVSCNVIIVFHAVAD